jgi:hypothetical protein
MTALTGQVEWLGLPPEVQKTITTLGPLILAGYSQPEMAKSVGQSQEWIGDRIAELKEALLQASGDLEEQLRERAEELRRVRGPGRARSV